VTTWRGGYSIFDSGVYRIHGLKWLFPQEKGTFDALVMFTSEAKMLKITRSFPITIQSKPVRSPAFSSESLLTAG
jgi:hypothetical protein